MRPSLSGKEKEYYYKTRILFISHSGELYGAERSLLTLVCGLQRLDRYEILVVVPDEGPLARALDDKDIPFRIIPFLRWIGFRYHTVARHYRRIRNRFLLGRLVREAERWMPDIIYTNTIATPAGAMAAEKLSPRPLHIWHARELPGDRSTGFGLFDYGTESSLRLIARTSDCFICNSRFLHDQLAPRLRRAAGPSKELRTEIVYNGLDTETYHSEPSDQLGKPADGTGTPLRMIMAGGVSRVKHYGEAVAAVKILELAGVSVLLDIYGSGDDEEMRKLAKEIEDAGLEKRVQLMGYRSDLGAEYARADLLLITSRMETFGRVAVEAMLAGCPVVSSDAGALPEIVLDGETGLVYRSGEPEHLVRQIRKLIDDPSLRNAIINRAREYAETHFSAERLVTEIDRILRDLIAGTKTTGADDTG